MSLFILFFIFACRHKWLWHNRPKSQLKYLCLYLRNGKWEMKSFAQFTQCLQVLRDQNRARRTVIMCMCIWFVKETKSGLWSVIVYHRCVLEIILQTKFLHFIISSRGKFSWIPVFLSIYTNIHVYMGSYKTTEAISHHMK